MATTSVINRGPINSFALNASNEAFDFGTWDVAIAIDSIAVIELIDSIDNAIAADSAGLLLSYTSTTSIAIGSDYTAVSQEWSDSLDIAIGYDIQSSTLYINKSTIDVGVGTDLFGALLRISESSDILTANDFSGLIELISSSDLAVGSDLFELVIYFNSNDRAIGTDASILSISISSITEDTGISSDASNPYEIGIVVISAYAINSDTGSVSSYTFPKIIEALETIDNTLYIATDTGLYAMDSDTDIGDPIVWSVSTGFSNLGSEMIKRVNDIDLLSRTSGDVHLKVITGRLGDKRRDLFRKPALTANTHRDQVIKVGRGLTSVYWGFELEGQNFADIDEFILSVLPLSRRR